jgi:hypothetical protein
MRGNEEEATAHRFNCSRAAHGGARQEVEDDQGDGPKEVAARASGGGRRSGRWAKQADSTEWASLAAGLVKGFGPNSRI